MVYFLSARRNISLPSIVAKKPFTLSLSLYITPHFERVSPVEQTNVIRRSKHLYQIMDNQQYASPLTQLVASKIWAFCFKIWDSCFDVSYLVAAFIIFWWSRRQPRRRSNKYFHSRHDSNGTIPSIIADDISFDSSSSSSSSSVSEDYHSPLTDPSWDNKVPTATMQERQRFYVGAKGDLRSAIRKLQSYLEWKTKHKRIEWDIRSSVALTGQTDVDDWRIAVAVAAKSRGETVDVTKIPQMGTMHALNNGEHMKDQEGNRIIHIIPGRMDDRLISLRTYALASALFMDRKMDATSLECLTVLIDVRAGVGWRNPNGAQLLPFIQSTSSLLLSLFPERLARCYVYPLPPSFEWVWKLVHRCLDPMTAEKIGVLTGPATIHSPPPIEAMEAYLDADVIKMLEDYRVSSFIAEK